MELIATQPTYDELRSEKEKLFANYQELLAENACLKNELAQLSIHPVNPS
ncbi:MAG: hypothetical protein ONB47_09705 [candidate division KSB1 bacterium]|nr:hypothetical protein [candidate division KSB1 bacterium]